MSNVTGVVHCGGIMTCSGYSTPNKINLSYDNSGFMSGGCANGINPTFDVSKLKNKTNADAFVYTNCDKEVSSCGDYSACSGDTPQSKLYVIKSSCSPHMFCTYRQNIDMKVAPKIINDNSKIFAKKLEARYDVPFESGTFDFEHLSDSAAAIVQQYRNVKANNVQIVTNNTVTGLDAMAFSLIIMKERNEVLSSHTEYYLSRHSKEGVDIEIVGDTTTTPGVSTVSLMRDDAVQTSETIVFSAYTKSIDTAWSVIDDLLDAAESGDTVQINSKMTADEFNGYWGYACTKRLELLDEMGTSDKEKFFDKLIAERGENVANVIKAYLSNRSIKNVNIKKEKPFADSATTVVTKKDASGETVGTTAVTFNQYSSSIGSSALNTFLNGVASGWTLQIYPNVTESETSGYTQYKVNTSMVQANSEVAPRIVLFADKTILTDYERFAQGNDYKRISNYDLGKPYESFTQNVTKVEFSFINDPNSAWKYRSGDRVSFADVPSATTKGMFSDCIDLITCDIPCQMRYVSEDTFKNCTRLSSYTTNPDHIDAIDENAFNNSGIKTAVIGKYTVLQPYAFNNANQIENIYWHNFRSGDTRCRLSSSGGTYWWKTNDSDGNYNAAIPPFAFKDCSKLKGTMFSGGANFTDAIYIPKGFKVIGESAFENCTSIKKVYLNDVTRLHTKAFANCLNLRLYGADNVTFFGVDAITDSDEVYVDGFSAALEVDDNAYSGKSIYALDSSFDEKIIDFANVLTIGSSAFENANVYGGLKITHNSGKTIEESAFENCIFHSNTSSLSGVTISGGLCDIEDEAFKNAEINGDVYLGNVNMVNNNNGYQFGDAKITGNTTISRCSLGENSFNNAYIYGKLIINNTNGIIADKAFYGVNVYDTCSVTASSIGCKTFEAANMESIDVSGITSIDSFGFSNCSSLSAMTLHSSTPPKLGGCVFDGCDSLTINVPCGSVMAYKTAVGWSDYDYMIESGSCASEYRAVESGYMYVGGDKYKRYKWQYTTDGSTWRDTNPLAVQVSGSPEEYYSSGSPKCQVATNGEASDEFSNQITLGGWAETINLSAKSTDGGEYAGFPEAYSDYTFYESHNHQGSSEGYAVIAVNNLDEFKFYAKASSEDNWDYLKISATDNFTTSDYQLSGESGWNEINVTFSNTNVHKILIAYTKDGSADKGYDKGYIAIPKLEDN